MRQHRLDCECPNCIQSRMRSLADFLEDDSVTVEGHELFVGWSAGRKHGVILRNPIPRKYHQMWMPEEERIGYTA